MKSRLSLISGVLAVLCFAVLAGFQSDGKIERPKLKEMIAELGYEVKDLVTDPGKEKYTFTVTKGGLDIPIGAEISPNGNFIWLTVNLGGVPDGEKALKLLRQNGSIQPSQFYVTKSDRLMCALPIENKLVNNAYMRTRIDSLSSNIVNTEDDWK